MRLEDTSDKFGFGAVWVGASTENSKNLWDDCIN